MLNALWRFLLTLIFVMSLFAILALAWEVPAYLGYPLPAELSKLPITLLTITALITGIWGTWSRDEKRVIITPPTKSEAYPMSPSIPDSILKK
jgi:hypothetical protein